VREQPGERSKGSSEAATTWESVSDEQHHGETK
jgi:hypothetical protein